MQTLEERVAFLEGRVEEHARNVEGVRQAVMNLEERMSSFEIRMDQRFQQVDARFTSLDAKVDARFTALEANLNGRFGLIDSQITSLTTTVVGALAAVVAVAGGLLFVLR